MKGSRMVSYVCNCRLSGGPPAILDKETIKQENSSSSEGNCPGGHQLSRRTMVTYLSGEWCFHVQIMNESLNLVLLMPMHVIKFVLLQFLHPQVILPVPSLLAEGWVFVHQNSQCEQTQSLQHWNTWGKLGLNGSGGGTMWWEDLFTAPVKFLSTEMYKTIWHYLLLQCSRSDLFKIFQKVV